MRGKVVWKHVGSAGTPDRSEGRSLGETFAGTANSRPGPKQFPAKLRVGDGQVDLLISYANRASALDPEERMSLLHCGQALFHMKQALPRFGPLGRVELFPDLDHTALVARVFCQFKLKDRPEEGVLLDAIARGQNECGQNVSG